MLNLIAAIPTVIKAVGKVTSLFRKGQKTVEEITGAPSKASTPEELRTEVGSMPPDQQNRWVEIMAKEVEMYAAQNERLATEIGLIDSNITGKLSEDAASDIAIMRMTTRPWAVRWMVYYVLFPFFLVVIDAVQNVLVTWLPFLQKWITPFGTFEYVFGVMKYPAQVDAGTLEKLAQMFSAQGGPATFAGTLYMDSIPWVVSVILGYMGLREVGKYKGYADNPPAESLAAAKPSVLTVAGKTISGGANLVSKVVGWFKK
jgi:hypothetical protein